MAIHQVNMSKFKLERQKSHASCWATAAICFCQYHGIAIADQDGLVQQHGGTFGGDPVPLLKQKGFWETGWLDWGTYDASQKQARCTELAEVLSSLDDGPILAVLTEYRDTAWQLTSQAAQASGRTSYTLAHAVIFYYFDDASGKVKFRDPARPPKDKAAPGPDVQTSLDELVEGFPYMSTSEFGTETMQKLQVGALTDPVRVRLKKAKSFTYMG